MTVIKRVMTAAEICGDHDVTAGGFYSHGLAGALENLVNRKTCLIAEYSRHHAGAVRPAVLQTHETLKEAAAGGPTPEQEWHHGISQSCSYKEFWQKADLSLGKVDKARLISLTKTCHQVRHFIS